MFQFAFCVAKVFTFLEVRTSSYDSALGVPFVRCDIRCACQASKLASKTISAMIQATITKRIRRPLRRRTATGCASLSGTNFGILSNPFPFCRGCPRNSQSFPRVTSPTKFGLEDPEARGHSDLSAGWRSDRPKLSRALVVHLVDITVVFVAAKFWLPGPSPVFWRAVSASTNESGPGVGSLSDPLCGEHPSFSRGNRESTG